MVGESHGTNAISKSESELLGNENPFRRIPTSRAEYCWSQADKNTLRKMVAEGYDYTEIAAQIGRTRAA